MSSTSRSASVNRLRNEPSFGPSSITSNRTGSHINSSKVNEETPVTETYAKFDEYEASFYSHLPAELNKLRNADFYHEEHRACIDPETSHSLLLTPTNAFVWKHTSITPSSCYIFPTLNRYPQESSFGCLVPFPNREPGLILTCTSGKILFWDSILSGLSGAAGFINSQVPLSSIESITGLFRCTSSCYIITSSNSILYRLTLIHGAGSWSVKVTPFRRPSSAFSIVASMFPGGYGKNSEDTVGALAFGPTRGTSTKVWILLSKTLQEWTVSEEGWEKLITEERDVLQIIALGLAQFAGAVFCDVQDLEISMIDLVILSSGELALLASYAQPNANDLNALERVYAIIKLDSQNRSLVVTQVQVLSYSPNEDAGVTNPHRLLILRDRLAVIQSGDRLLLTSLYGKYNSVLPLKSPLDRFLAITCIPPSTGASESLIAITASGMLEIKIDLAATVQGSGQEQEISFLEKIMTQAILYGSLPYNPLQFSLPPQIEGSSLCKAAEQISNVILKGLDSSLAPPPSLDMQTNLSGRVDRLHRLIEFIANGGMLPKLTPSCRIRLQNDVERLSCANALWIWFNGQALAAGGKVLVHSINSFVSPIGEPQEPDLVRMFFRTQLHQLADLLPRISAMAKAQHATTIDDQVTVAIDANSIANTLIRESWRHRKEFKTLYHVELGHDVPNFWTADLDVLDALNDLFALSVSVLQELKIKHGNLYLAVPNPFNEISPAQTLLGQLGDLARFIFSCSSQRQGWLSCNGTDFERDDFHDKMMKSRKTQLSSLADFGLADAAFDLTEDYGDFQNLAMLCVHLPTTSVERIYGYLDRYRESFASTLYHLYIKNQMVYNLFSQDPRYSNLVNEYFKECPMPRASWIQDINCQRYDGARNSLLEEAGTEKKLEVKNAILSISLLSHYAATGSAPTKDVQLGASDTADFITVQLSYISVQQQIRGIFERVFSEDPTARHCNLDIKSDLVLRSLFSNLDSRPGMQKMIKRGIRQVLEERSLEKEDLLEVISSQDKVQPEVDYSTAIRLLARSQDLDDGTRVRILRTIWRKLFVNTDWAGLQNTAGLSDTQINNRIRATLLYRTLCNTTGGLYNEERLHPEQAAIIPTIEELERRWLGVNSEFLEEIWDDYEWERQQIDNGEVSMLYERVVTLERNDRSSDMIV